MKKESKNYNALDGRFILVAIFFLLIGNRAFAQCEDSGPGSACHTNINFDPTCYVTYMDVRDITDLKQSGLVNVTSVSILGNSDPNIASMNITDIFIKNAACTNNDGPYTAADFPSGYGITFENSALGTREVRIRVTNPDAGINLAISVGDFISFNVTAFNDVGPIVVRKYFFEIVGHSYILGDTHILTVDGVKYDFQAVGEFVSLRSDTGDNFEIQTRQSAVATTGLGTDRYSGLSTCVSVNTAVAARVGKHRVTYQPNINGRPDPNGMQLRVDGKLTELGENGLDLESGGRIMKSPAAAGAIEIEFPNGASLVVTPAWWSRYSQWYLNLAINNTAATKGISGVIPYNETIPGNSERTKSWLPALPDGSSVGPMPTSPQERYEILYKKFADAWRVTDQTSLFEYASGTSTATFTDKNWPSENAQSCGVPGQTPQAPIERAVAEKLASGIVDPNLREFAIFDVMVTGEPEFAEAYLLTEKIQTSTTATALNVSKDTTKYGEPVTFTARVARKFSAGKDDLTGTVEFTVDGKKIEQVKLEADGRAILTTEALEVGQHQIVATFIPDSGSPAFSSSSLGSTHTVIGATSILHQWWVWLVVFLVIAGLIIALRRKKKNP